MTCCAIADCGDSTCGVCTVNVRFVIEQCPRIADDRNKTVRCTLIAGHPGVCRMSVRKPAEQSKPATRDGDPKLAGERKRQHPMFQKRSRAGAVWVPRERRVE